MLRLLSANRSLRLATQLLALVTSDSPRDSIILALEAITSTFDVALCLRCGDLALAAGVLFLPRLLPRLSAGQVADGLDDGTLSRVELTSGLAITEDGGLIGLVKQQCGC